MKAVEVPAQSRLTLSTLLGCACAVVSFGIGAQKLGDNSFLTHLATGRLMLDEGIVRKDAFTWTSGGEPLVVQSWLASLLYGIIDNSFGFAGLRLLMAASACVLGWLAWQLTDRAPSVISRVVVIAPVLVIGVHTWNERPLLLAFVFFATVMLAAERNRDPRWLAALGFLWVNIHGSWPLGIVLLFARWFGARLDRDLDAGQDARRAVWLAGGMLAGGIANPYGPAMLWFPFELLGRHDTLRQISEWQASSFESTWTRLFLVLLAATIFASRRAPLRLVAPGVLFVIAALLSVRNIPIAVIVLLPLLAEGLPDLHGPDANRDSTAIRLGTVGFVAMVAMLAVLAVLPPHTSLEQYPVAAVDAMEELDLSPAGHHVLHQDFVGNYLGFRFGGVGAVWIDDRFELHDPALVADYVALLHARPRWRDVIEQNQPDAVLWERDRALVDLLITDGWSVVWADDKWVVLTPA
jgi:hypothetical protein